MACHPAARTRVAIAGRGNGYRWKWCVRTGWAASGDALLAFDADGNGEIDHFNEISFTGYLPGATTDLEGLAAFDTNGDGRLTAQDALWSKLQLWQDRNQDGLPLTTVLGWFDDPANRKVASFSLAANDCEWRRAA